MSGLGDWKNQWKPEKQGWCCLNKKLGCFTAQDTAKEKHSIAMPATTTTTPTTTLPFDCRDGTEGVDSWRREKKDWCCLNHHVGCDLYNCTKGLDNTRSWLPAKVIWCCHKKKLGCPGQPNIITTVGQFDCAAGLSRWEHGWSPSKKSWCCEHHDIACGHYNCHEDLGHWQSAWPKEKKVWCCEKANLGCGTTTTLTQPPTQPPAPRAHLVDRQSETDATFDCSAGLARWESAWSKPKKQWCCDRMQIACSPFNCHEDVDAWHSKWSGEKKSWCCKSAGIGCAKHGSSSHASAALDNEAAYECSSHIQDWSAGQEAWCCQHAGRGCTSSSKPPLTASKTPPPTTTRQKYDCTSWFGDWEQAWHGDQKAWCCKHHGRGCTTTTAATTPATAKATTKPAAAKEVAQKATATAHATTVKKAAKTKEHYDCEAGFKTWEKGWSDAKQVWCCKRTGRGCMTDSYDCYGAEVDEESHQDWVHNWPKEHRSWCCDKKGIGCDTTRMTLIQAKYGQSSSGAAAQVSQSPRAVTAFSVRSLAIFSAACLLLAAAAGLVKSSRPQEGYREMQRDFLSSLAVAAGRRSSHGSSMRALLCRPNHPEGDAHSANTEAFFAGPWVSGSAVEPAC